MDNILKYKQYEMVILNKPTPEVPNEWFTKKEIISLEYNESGKFNLIDRFKAVCLISGYRITIHKRSTDDFYYRIRDLKKSFSPIILENRVKTLRDCLYDIDEFMYEKLKEDKEKEKLKKLDATEKTEQTEQDIYSGKSFSGKVNF